MKTGTKSLLWGYHQVFLHPLFVAAGWTKLYGFPLDPRLWVAFVVHDWGYWGKPNMDGKEGTLHPFTGARIAGDLFDPSWESFGPWYKFCLFHSRSICKQFVNQPLSKLGYADKQAFLFYPQWLMRLLFAFSGEGREYLIDAGLADWAAWYEMAASKNSKTVAKSGLPD